MIQNEKVETIDHIRKRFKDNPQWLLIRITKWDVRTTTMLEGILLAHDANPSVIMEKSSGLDGLISIDHSHPGRVPKGYVLAL